MENSVQSWVSRRGASDVKNCLDQQIYLITLSARARTFGGIVRPILGRNGLLANWQSPAKPTENQRPSLPASLAQQIGTQLAGGICRYCSLLNIYQLDSNRFPFELFDEYETYTGSIIFVFDRPRLKRCPLFRLQNAAEIAELN